jgi:hypothetical protein
MLARTFNVSALGGEHVKQTIQITETALQLGSVTSPGWTLIVNRNITNYVNVKTGTGGVYPVPSPLRAHKTPPRDPSGSDGTEGVATYTWVGSVRPTGVVASCRNPIPPAYRPPGVLTPVLGQL